MLKNLSESRRNAFTLCAAFLGIFTFLKLVFPDAVIALATTPSLTKLGTAIDENIALNVIIQFAMGYVVYFLYTCAACRIHHMNAVENVIVIAVIILQLVFVYAGFYTLNTLVVDLSLLCLPLVFTMIRKTISVKHFYSTIISYTAHNCTQAFSLNVRGLSDRLEYPTLVSVYVLMIDTYIVLLMLYLFYASKLETENDTKVATTEVDSALNVITDRKTVESTDEQFKEKQTSKTQNENEHNEM